MVGSFYWVSWGGGGSTHGCHVGRLRTVGLKVPFFSLWARRHPSVATRHPINLLQDEAGDKELPALAKCMGFLWRVHVLPAAFATIDSFFSSLHELRVFAPEHGPRAQSTVHHVSAEESCDMMEG